MKRLAWLLILMTALSSPLAAESGYTDGRSERNMFVRMMILEYRGVMNIVGMPVEIVRSGVAEVKTHHWLWPFTYPPRLVTNVITRTVSAAYDMVILPLTMPFSNDMTPLTDPMGLPDYPWQMTGEGF